MTLKGESMTAKGEIQGQMHLTGANCLQIFSFRRKNDKYEEVIEVSGTDADDETETTKPQVHLVFCMECDVDANEENPIPFHSFKRYEHNIILFQSSDIYQRWRQRADMDLICISMDINFLKRYLPVKRGAFAQFCHCVECQTPAMLSNVHLTISPKIATVLNDITTCTQTGFFKKLYLEAKVIELLTLQFEQHEELANHNVNVIDALSVDIVSKMNEVKYILMNDINTKLSLKELANKVGTNEHTLKNAFKKMFGNTVFGYLHQFKMEKARQMLLEKDVRIADVSEEMGYKHATHFTSAFKKYFGYLPKKILLFLLIPVNELEFMFMILNPEFLILA